jgi:hypothetical protein
MQEGWVEFTQCGMENKTVIEGGTRAKKRGRGAGEKQCQRVRLEARGAARLVISSLLFAGAEWWTHSQGTRCCKLPSGLDPQLRDSPKGAV